MNKIEETKVQHVDVFDESLSVDLTNGRTVSVPVAWYPSLLHATDKERNNWRLIGAGEGIDWPDLDEDISLENLRYGKASGESQRARKRWVAEQKMGGGKA